MCRTASPAPRPSRVPLRATARRCAGGAPRSRDRIRPGSTSDGDRLYQQRPAEGDLEPRVRAGDLAVFPVVDVITEPIAAGRETAQRHGPREITRIKRIIEAARLLDGVRFRFVETDVVELAAIDPERQ